MSKVKRITFIGLVAAIAFVGVNAEMSGANAGWRWEPPATSSH